MSVTAITPLAIPSDLADKLKERMIGTEFKSLADYITHILRLSLSDHDDEQKVKERLRGLGYLD